MCLTVELSSQLFEYSLHLPSASTQQSPTTSSLSQPSSTDCFLQPESLFRVSLAAGVSTVAEPPSLGARSVYSFVPMSTSSATTTTSATATAAVTDSHDNNHHPSQRHHHYTIPHGKGRELLDADRATALLPPPTHTHYTRITLSGKSFSLPAAQVFAPLLAGQSRLTEADLSDIIAQRNTEEAIAVLDCLCSAVAHHPLHALNLSDNAIGARGVEAVSQALRRQTALQRVTFNNDGLQGSAVAVLVDALLHPYRTSDEQAANQPRPPTALYVPNASSQPTSIRHIELIRNLLPNRDPEPLVPLILSSPHLTHFILASTRLSPAGGLAIANALSSSGLTSLVHIDLHDGKLGPEAGLVLANQLLTPAKTAHLTHLNLGDIDVNDRDETGTAIRAIIVALRTAAPHLQHLDLHHNDITPRLTTLLARSLHNKTHLTHLCLDDNPIGTRGTITLLPLLPPSLASLSLREVGLNTKAVPALVRWVGQGGVRGRRLEVNGNKIRAEGVEELRRSVDESGEEGVLGSLSENEEDEEDEEEEEAEVEEEEADEVIEQADAVEGQSGIAERPDDKVDALADELAKTKVG